MNLLVMKSRVTKTLLLISFLTATSFAFSREVESTRPNVVLIISDDQGWGDYGFMGHDTIQTPHLDQLARRSLLFERGYVASPLCRPSLASIVTGLHPHQHGVCANDVSPARKLARDKENRPVVESFHRHTSLVQTLVDQGYLAFQSGKWWEGSWRDGGFTHGMTHGDPVKGGRHGDVGLKIGRTGMKPALDFIDNAMAEEKPFFVWYAPFLPHTPHNPPSKILEKYQSPRRAANVAKYGAMCTWFDETCGELLHHLDRRSLTNNTIILYVCDNGWAPVDRSADNPEGWWPDYAPRSKGSPFEKGIRTPIMISWPGHVDPKRAPELASSIDLMPTVLRACRIEPPANLPGLDLLNETARKNRDAIFGASYSIHNMMPGDPASTLQYRWCIEGNWKLLLRSHGVDTTRYITVHQWDKIPVRLYNLQEDPNEQMNLAGENKELVRRLSQRIEAQIPLKSQTRNR
ncbi:MAG TPA: sulfatase-like hydrolase/transferase [Pirellulaceae bacterium]|nr:sulfatase-like hydrolase/transferase [Pirellulaceae bacterium]